jgi:phage baseplate assembly protein V
MGQVWHRLQLLFAQGLGLMIGNDKVQVRVLDGEPLNNIDRVEPYGFSYRPKPGCRSYLLFPAGDRSYGVAIIIGDKRYQMMLEEGEVALHDDEENWVHIKRGGTIHVKASTQVFAETPLFKTSGNAEIGGNLVVKGNTSSTGGYYGTNGGVAVMQGGLYITGEFKVNGKNVSDSHTHNTPSGVSLGVN